MSSNIESFDIVLVYTGFRRHDFYLNIVKILSSKNKVGIYRCGINHKWEPSEDLFLQKMQELGATILDDCVNKTKALVLPRFGSGYLKHILEELPKKLSFKKVFIMNAGLMDGVLYPQEIFKHLGPFTVLVPSRDFFGQYEPNTIEQLNLCEGVEIREVGFPFGKFPAIEGFSADYVVAYPSHVSVTEILDEYALLRNMAKVVKKLSKDGSSLYVKVHNVRDIGNRLSSRLLFNRFIGANFISRILFNLSAIFDLKILGKPLYRFLPKRIISYLARLQNDCIFMNCKNLTDEFPPFGMEHYIPFVKKGLITGLSNTVVLALYYQKPVHVILNDSIEHLPSSYQHMVKTFGINNWGPGFSSEAFSKIPTSSRQANLAQYFEGELASL